MMVQSRHSSAGSAPRVGWKTVGGDTLYLKQMELGPMQNFVYLIGDPAARECVVVAPAWEIDTIAETVERHDMRLVGGHVTQTHRDHAGGSLESWVSPRRLP